MNLACLQMVSGLVPSNVMGAFVCAIFKKSMTSSLHSLFVRLCMVLGSDLGFIFNDVDFLFCVFGCRH